MAANPSLINVFSYSSTNVTTGAYVTLIVSTPITVSKLLITDTSGELLKLAYGPVGSETDICSIPVSGSVVIPTYIVAGQRLAIKAINSNATTGYNVVSFLNV